MHTKKGPDIIQDPIKILIIKLYYCLDPFKFTHNCFKPFDNV